jgi:hypothetical protein
MQLEEMEEKYSKFISTIENSYDSLMTSSFSKGFWEKGK